MILETERLILRPWREDDAEKLYNIASDPDVGPATGWPAHESVEQSREVIRNLLSHEGNYAILLKETGELIGDIGVKRGADSTLVRDETEVEFGCWLGKKYWGNGYVPEGISALMERLMSEGIKGFWYGFYKGNDKSKRVAEKLGFKYSHTVADHYIKMLDKTTTLFVYYYEK